MKIEIPHIINDTDKEIYCFELSCGWWLYKGIYYSHRDDKNDIWGDEWWTKTYNKRKSELDKEAQKRGYTDIDEWYNNILGDYQTDNYNQVVRKIEKKYQAIRLKTKHGKIRYYGQYGGLDKHPTPKLTAKQIQKEIVRQLSKIKVKL